MDGKVEIFHLRIMTLKETSFQIALYKFHLEITKYKY